MIYGKDILDSVYALVGKFFERSYKSGLDESDASKAEDANAGNIPLVSIMHEEIMGDLGARIPFIIATACTDLCTLDGAYRKAYGLDEQTDFSGVFIGLEEELPLCEAFTQAVVLYCASMLLIDIESERSDNLFEKYADTVSKISASLPSICESIVEKN